MPPGDDPIKVVLFSLNKLIDTLDQVESQTEIQIANETGDMDQVVSGDQRLARSRAVATEPSLRSGPCLVAHNGGPDDASSNPGIEVLAAACRNPRALIVDDNECNRVLLAHMVALAGGTSVQAADGVEALERLAEGAFDIVFMDIAMPRMDGIAATVEIRRRNIQVMILAVTAQYDARDVSKLMEIGFDGLIPKPIDLVVVLSWLLKRAEARASAV